MIDLDSLYRKLTTSAYLISTAHPKNSLCSYRVSDTNLEPQLYVCQIIPFDDFTSRKINLSLRNECREHHHMHAFNYVKVNSTIK